MTLLTLVRKACPRIGIPRPLVVAAATDSTVLLILELLQQEGNELARYGDWRALRAEKTFTTNAAETQTDTPIATDLTGFVDDTMWNRSLRRRMYGPATSEEWQRWKAGNTFPVNGTFYLRGTSFLIQPTPVAGQTVAYEYRSGNWCQSTGAVAQSAWAADSDTGRLSERLMGLGLIWRFKENRLPGSGQAEKDTYYHEVDNELAAEQPRRIIDLKMDGPPSRIPGLVIPEGSWVL